MKQQQQVGWFRKFGPSLVLGIKSKASIGGIMFLEKMIDALLDKGLLDRDVL